MKIIKNLGIFYPKTVENNPQSHLFFIMLDSKFKGSGFKGLKFRSCSVSTTPVKHKEGLTGQAEGHGVSRSILMIGFDF
jgi:hypothetical protein